MGCIFEEVHVNEKNFILNRFNILISPDPVDWVPFLFNFVYFFLINPLRAKFFRGNINIYLHFVSFLHIDTTQVFEIPVSQTRTNLFYIVNIMAADVLAT